jgi:hypothetical protein
LRRVAAKTVLEVRKPKKGVGLNEFAWKSVTSEEVGTVKTVFRKSFVYEGIVYIVVRGLVK